MRPRFLDVMGDALSLVRNSNVAEATAVIRRALSGMETRDRDGDPPPERGAAGRPPKLVPRSQEAIKLPRAAPLRDREPQPEPGPAFAPATARRLGEVLGALRSRPSLVPGDAPAPATEPPHDFGEKFTSRTWRGAAGSLNYRLYVPAELRERDPALVLMLHGCTQNPDDFALGTQMNSLADEFGLVVAYPHQPRRANASGCWNWFDKRHQNRGSGEPARLAGLALALAGEFGVRRERIFVAGLSAGGAMAEVLAVTYPDVFAAVGVHSGLPYKSAADVPSAFAAMRGTPIIHPDPQVATESRPRRIIFHGGADATVHPVNSERIRDSLPPGPDELERLDLDWDVPGGRVNRTVLKDAEGRPVVEHWFVEGGGHAWFGGDPRGTYTQSVGIDASRVMVRFFLNP